MGFFKKLFSRAGAAPTLLSGASPDERLDELLAANRDRLKRFLVTRSKPSGMIKKTDRWQLTRTNPGLFRLDAPNCSLLISTEPFLVRKDGKIGGLLRMSETELNHSLRGDQPLDGFLDRAEPLAAHSRGLLEELRTGESSPEVFDENPGLEDIKLWDNFEVDQMIAHNSPNTLAHILIHASPDAREKIRDHLSNRMKGIIVTELETLLSAGSHPELNPHSRTRSLVQFEEALSEFQDSMREFRRKEYVSRMRAEKQKSDGLRA